MSKFLFTALGQFGLKNSCFLQNCLAWALPALPSKFGVSLELCSSEVWHGEPHLSGWSNFQS